MTKNRKILRKFKKEKRKKKVYTHIILKKKKKLLEYFSIMNNYPLSQSRFNTYNCNER